MKKMLFKGILSLGLMGALMNTTVNAAEEVKAEKEWTFLVFVNADNNLDRFGVGDMEEATEIGSSDKVNIIFQMDRAYGKPCKRYFIKKGEAEMIEDMGEVDMGDINVFNDFVEWGATNYPAKHYAAIMWNHGSGWNKKGSVIKGISYDDESGNHITTAQLTTGLAKTQEILGQKLDILAFDACLMQMAEVAYAVKDSVNIMLASEETEPGEGWPYNDCMGPIVKNPTMGVEKVATAIVDGYDKSYDGGSQGNSSTTQSWVKLSNVDALAAAIKKLAVALEGQYTAELTAAVNAVQKFYYRSNVDLIHLLTLLDKSIGIPEVKEALVAAKAAVGHHATHGYSMKNSHGTAIYFPSRGYSFSSKYRDLDWTKATGWDKMLDAYYEATKTRTEDL